MADEALPCFVINLPRSTARRAHMQRQLDALHLPAIFVDAVDGRAFTPAEARDYDLRRALRVYGTELTPTELACCRSHLAVLTRIAALRLPAALVLEDDMFLQPQLPAVLRELAAMPDGSWQMVRLTALRGRVMTPLKPSHVGVEIARLGHGTLHRLNVNPLGAGAYVVTWRGAERIIAHAGRIFAPWDHMLDRFWENGLPPYIIRPLQAVHDQEGPSDIGAARGTKAFTAFRPIVAVQRFWQRQHDSVAKAWHLHRLARRPSRNPTPR